VLEQRFGAKLSPTLVDWFDDPYVADRLPFRLWLPESWIRLTELARTEQVESSTPTLPDDVVVIGERTDSPDDYDSERGYMASQGVFYGLSPSSWSSTIVPLFRWRAGQPVRQIQADIARLPQIQHALADRWLRTQR
jgi:hypothetical protein